MSEDAPDVQRVPEKHFLLQEVHDWTYRVLSSEVVVQIEGIPGLLDSWTIGLKDL